MRARFFLLTALVAPLLIATAPPVALSDDVRASAPATVPDNVPVEQCTAHSQAPGAAEVAASADARTTQKSAPPEVLQALMPAGVATLPVVADGSKDPEQIPMALAYRHLVRFIAIHQADPPAELTARRDHQMKMMGLGADSATAVRSALRGVREQLDNIEKERKGVSPAAADAPAQLTDLVRQERELLDNAGERLRNSLDANAADRLDTYVQKHVRSRIIIYGAMPQ